MQKYINIITISMIFVITSWCYAVTDFKTEDWYTSALKYHEHTVSLGRATPDQIVNDLLTLRVEEHKKLLASVSPNDQTILELIRSMQPDSIIAGLVNIDLRNNHKEKFLKQILNSEIPSYDSEMMSFYIYSYIEGFDNSLLTQYEEPLLELIRNETNFNNFLMSLPLLLKIKSQKSFSIIKDFIDKTPQNLRMIICADIKSVIDEEDINFPQCEIFY